MPSVMAFSAALRTTSSEVPLSLPGYETLFLGRTARCDSNDCAAATEDTFVDAAVARLHLEKSDVGVFASWSRLARAAARDPSKITLDAPPDGPSASSGPPWWNARFDEETWRRSMRFLEKNKPRLLVISLLDPDEHAHAGRVLEYTQSLQRLDAWLVELKATLKRLELDDDTTVLITADHGRDPTWTDHGSRDEGRAIFLGAFGRGIDPQGRVTGGPPLTQRTVRATVDALLSAP